jgi:transcriptional repressor NrdR
VVKKDGRREAFSRDKILRGLTRACEKRPIPAAKLAEIVDRIENEFQRGMQREITSRQIGEKVMEELHRLDEVAYVRFASVYRHFKDISQFMEELKGLLGSE